jgi:hypothetical protein
MKSANSAYKTAFYPETAFGGFTDIDGTIAFYVRVNALVEPSFRIVDFGCGRGGQAEDPIAFRRNLRCFKGRVARIIGLDVDIAGRTNPCLDEFRSLMPDASWGRRNRMGEFDYLRFCDGAPGRSRGLIPRGQKGSRARGGICVSAPLMLTVTSALSRRLVPNKHHAKITSKAQADRKEEDVFPTLYRCNTISAIRRQMRLSGFQSLVYGYEAEPSYLEFSKLAYALGVLHQKYACSFMRPVILAFGRVPE